MIPKRTPANERAERAYLCWLGGSQGRHEASLDAVAKALELFDEYNKRRDFAKFHFEQALGFKARLIEQHNARTGAPLSASTIKSTLAARRNEAEYFNPPDNLARIAGAHRRRPCPTLAWNAFYHGKTIINLRVASTFGLRIDGTPIKREV